MSCRPVEHTWKACCLQHHSYIGFWLRFFHCLVLVINSWDSTSIIMTRLCTGKSRIWILAGAKGHFSKMSKPALVPTHLPVQLVLGAVSLGVEWPGHETNHLPPYSAKVNFEWRYTSTPPTCLCGLYRDNFAFTFSILELILCSQWCDTFISVEPGSLATYVRKLFYNCVQCVCIYLLLHKQLMKWY